MKQRASTALKIAYGLVLLGSIFPFGLAKSSWVSMATGGGLGMLGLLGVVPLALGFYRLYLIARVPGTLDSPAAVGFVSVLRLIGKFLIYAGVVVPLLSWSGRLLLPLVLSARTDSGAEFFMAGLVLYLAGSIGIFGLLLFEFSRLLAFERQHPG